MFEIAEEFGLFISSHYSILSKNLSMKRHCVQFMPQLLTGEQRDQRCFMASDLFERTTESAQTYYLASG